MLITITLCAYIVLLLTQLRQAVLEASHITLNLLISFTHFVWDESLEAINKLLETGSVELLVLTWLSAGFAFLRV